ncbi:hypothetical protein CC85DRAFT_253277, partial [Cutaneotrichosporon oleaginosum]
MTVDPTFPPPPTSVDAAPPTNTTFVKDVDINPALNSDQRAAVVRLLHQHSAAFSQNGSVGRTTLTTFTVDTADSEPIGQAPYHASPRQRQAIDEALDRMIADKQIQPSSSPWSSPVIVVTQNGKPR